MTVTRGEVAAFARSPSYEPGIAAKRVLDVVVAFAGLVCLAPLMVLIAFATFVDGGRPIFFSQVRLGQRGQYFRLYKFRKFHAKGQVNAQALTVKNDPRLTRVGKFLARTKLDEVPQLWNVFRGDMSIVGPRPETLDFADCFGESYQNVLAYKPGIFGPNQVFFRNEGRLYHKDRDPEKFYRDILFPLKARVDLMYFPNSNIWDDIAWIARGVFAVFGWSPLPRGGKNLLEEVEQWIRQTSSERNADPLVN